MQWLVLPALENAPAVPGLQCVSPNNKWVTMHRITEETSSATIRNCDIIGKAEQLNYNRVN